MSEFIYRDFTLETSQTVFPITSDTVLLESNIDVQDSKHILEVGIGQGLICFSIAMRYPHIIVDGIDCNEDAILLAHRNKARLSCENVNFFKSRFQDFISNKYYDLIICNPPYFDGGLKPITELKRQAKHTEDFNPMDFANFVVNHIEEHGRIHLIIPYSMEGVWSFSMNTQGLILNKLIEAYHDASSIKPKLVIVSYSKSYLSFSRVKQIP